MPPQNWKKKRCAYGATAMVDVIRISTDENPIEEARREWLVTNGLGGFASAAISGEITRRYHGFLIAALPAPLGRIVMLNDVETSIERPDGSVARIHDAGRFIGFTLAMGLPSWRYEIGGLILEKSVVMPARHNIVHITFRIIEGEGPVRLRLYPFINFRRLEAAVDESLAANYAITAQGRRYEVTSSPDIPALRLMMSGCENATFTANGGRRRECTFATEGQRGYEA